MKHDGLANGLMVGRKDTQTASQADNKQTDRQIDVPMDGRTNRQTDKQSYRHTDGLTARRMGGQTARWTDGQTDGKMYTQMY